MQGILFADLEIADANELSRICLAFCPNIPVGVLGDPDYQSKGLTIGFGQATESPILEKIQSVIHSHPHVAGAIFQQGSDLIARKTIRSCEWM